MKEGEGMEKKIEGEGGVGREGIWAGLSLSLSSLKEKIEMTRWGGSLSIHASLSIYYLTYLVVRWEVLNHLEKVESPKIQRFHEDREEDEEEDEEEAAAKNRIAVLQISSSSSSSSPSLLLSLLLLVLPGSC